jgi:hypothetical protein
MNPVEPVIPHLAHTQGKQKRRRPLLYVCGSARTDRFAIHNRFHFSSNFLHENDLVVIVQHEQHVRAAKKRFRNDRSSRLFKNFAKCFNNGSLKTRFEVRQWSCCITIHH